MTMLYRKTGLPEEGEFVLCTVANVQYNVVFVRLDEYGREAVIHISEISPGRIRNIRDYVKEGKKIVCKVLRVRKDTGNIDVSLRRVADVQKRRKLNEIKLEQRSEKLLELIAKDAKKPFDIFYKEISGKIFVHYPTLSSCFEDVVAGNFKLVDAGIVPAVAETITKEIMTKIKPPEVVIEGSVSIKTYSPEGVEIVKKGLALAEGEKTTITYSGAGTYRITVKAEDYKSAEEMMRKKAEAVIRFIEEMDGAASFSRKGE